MSPRKLTVSADELADELRSPERRPMLVDVREPEEFAEGYIEGGKLIPLGEISVRGPRELDPEADIVLYCAHGVRSLHALRALEMQGFTRVRSLEGGIAAWYQHLNSSRS